MGLLRSPAAPHETLTCARSTDTLCPAAPAGPHAWFVELVRLSETSIAGEMRIEHTRRVLGE
jgi:hypothetical protein